jgi:hypothetical protein
MRTSSFLVILLCALVPVCGASDSARQSASPQAAVNSFNSDWFDPAAIAQHDFIKLPASDRGDREYRGFNSERDGDVTCYTIQNFLVKREPHSDVTVPSGYSTCLPASKYSVKKVEEPGQAPSR